MIEKVQDFQLEVITELTEIQESIDAVNRKIQSKVYSDANKDGFLLK